jgi:hypothetical protein
LRRLRFLLLPLVLACGSGLASNAPRGSGGASGRGGANAGGAPGSGGAPGRRAKPTYDPCKNKRCGDLCNLCAPDDQMCVETAQVKFCSAAGRCGVDEPACPGR